MGSDLRERGSAREPRPRPAAVAESRARRLQTYLLLFGALLLVMGFAVLGLLAWQLWGTGLSTERAQSELRRQLSAELAESTWGSGTNFDARITSTPTPGQPIAELRIPKIHLDMVVVEGTTAPELAKGPGHYVGTAYPWDGRGRVGIAGHRTTYLHPFWALDRLSAGDQISLKTRFGTYVYRVLGSRTVLPQDAWVLNDTQGPTLVLTTCTPKFSASHRLIVFARRVEASRLGPSRGDEAQTEAQSLPNELVPNSNRLLPGDPGPGSRSAVLLVGALVAVGLLVGVWQWSHHRRRGRDRLLAPHR